MPAIVENVRIPVIPPVPAEEQKMPADASHDLDASLATLGLALSQGETSSVSFDQANSAEECRSVSFTASTDKIKLHALSNYMSARFNWTDADGNTGSFRIWNLPVDGGAKTNPNGRWAKHTITFFDGLTRTFIFDLSYGYYSDGKNTPYIDSVRGRLYRANAWTSCELPEGSSNADSANEVAKQPSRSKQVAEDKTNRAAILNSGKARALRA